MKILILILTLWVVGSLTATWTLYSMLIESQQQACPTYEEYISAFIEAHNTGSSFAFYRDGEEYEFAPKYNW
jgi:hypothetical protein